MDINLIYHFGAHEPKRKPDSTRYDEYSPHIKGTGLELINIKFDEIFPVFYKYYDDSPVGKAILRNNEKVACKDIKVSLLVKEYMVNPKECKTPSRMDASSEQEIDLYGLFTNEILGITEGTKVSANIFVEYTINGKPYHEEYIETIRIYDRNAITWDDDKKAAAFVTTKDTAVLKFSKNVAGMIKGKVSSSLNDNLLSAMGMFNAISLYGIKYITDPSSAYEVLSQDKLKVDFLQFPRQTLDYKSGDCDDLTVLYCALLESLGIKTAFITIPGHIFMAFSMDVKPEYAQSTFVKPDNYIYRGDQTWVPVEITALDNGFLNAWNTGAKEWREYSGKDKAGFYPVYEAWEKYEPVGFTEPAEGIVLPAEDTLIRYYLEEVMVFVEQEIFPREEKYKAEIKRTGGNVKSVNGLGVLYAKYGLYDKALVQFNIVLKKNEYVPALINAGNIYYLKGEMEKSLTYYERAYTKMPDNPKVLLCVARVNHEMENYGTVKKLYAKLKDLDPGLADEFAYLDLRGDEAARAAEVIKAKGVVLWEEE
jgi:hypothetical protein